MNTINSRKTLDQIGFALLSIVDTFASKIDYPLNRFRVWPGSTLPKWNIYPDGRVEYDFGDETFIVIGTANAQILVPNDSIDVQYGSIKINNTENVDANEAIISNATKDPITRKYTYTTETTSTVSSDVTKLVEIAITDTFGIGGTGSSLPVNVSNSIAQKYSTTIKNTIEKVNSTSSSNEVTIDVPAESAVKITTDRTLSQQTQAVNMLTNIDFNGIQFVSSPGMLRPGEKTTLYPFSIKYKDLDDLTREANGLKPILPGDSKDINLPREAVAGKFIGYDPRAQYPEYFNINLDLDIQFNNASTDDIIAKPVPIENETLCD